MQTFFRLTLITLGFSLTIAANSQNVGINSTGAVPNASAMLDIQSNSKGLLIPRMTTAERIAIVSPATGLLVFDTNSGSFWFRRSTGWEELLDVVNSPWIEDTFLNLRTRNGGSVSLTPGSPLGSGKLNVVAQTPETNTTESMLQLLRTTSGTAATGIGGSIDFFNEVSNGGFSTHGRIICKSVDVTPGDHASTMEFLTASNGMLTTQLYLGAANVGIGTALPSIFSKLDVDGTINTNAKITRNTVTGLSNLVPMCYGAVDAVGNITAGTGNFTVLKTSTGAYTISNASFDGNCIVIITPRGPNIGSFAPRMIMSSFFSGDIVLQAFNSSGVAADSGFHFMVYKQ
jgi:hypothetical protein